MIAKQSGVSNVGISVPQFGTQLDSLGRVVWKLLKRNSVIHIQTSKNLI